MATKSLEQVMEHTPAQIREKFVVSLRSLTLSRYIFLRRVRRKHFPSSFCSFFCVLPSVRTETNNNSARSENYNQTTKRRSKVKCRSITRDISNTVIVRRCKMFSESSCFPFLLEMRFFVFWHFTLASNRRKESTRRPRNRIKMERARKGGELLKWRKRKQLLHAWMLIRSFFIYFLGSLSFPDFKVDGTWSKRRHTIWAT